MAGNNLSHAYIYVCEHWEWVYCVCGNEPEISLGVIPRYYAWDYRVLRTFAKHYSTGEIIPEKLVKSMQGARDMFAATELQRQVYFPKNGSC